MSSIKDLLQEEKDAEGVLKEAEQRAAALAAEARARAAEIIGKARGDDALVKELTARSEERIAAQRKRILEECEARAAEAEARYGRNVEAAASLVYEGIVGARR